MPPTRSTPSQAIYEGAIPGMLRRLDPFTVFFDPGQFEQLKELEKSTRKGFGSVVSILPGRVIVLQTLPGTPSASSGMTPGDEIVGGQRNSAEPPRNGSVGSIADRIAQSAGPARCATAGQRAADSAVLRPRMWMRPSVERAYLIRPGYRLSARRQFRRADGQSRFTKRSSSLGGAQLKGLLLDLRNNPGGVVGSALETASLFLKPGQTIVSVRGRSVGADEVKVPKEAKPYSFPVAILVNGKTASASEIVSGALQDHKRASIVGEQSFGKGLVQSVMPLSQGTAMALTTAFYYTPNGRSIQRSLPGQLAKTTTGGGHGGIKPDQIVFPEEMTRLRAVLDATGSFTSFATAYIARVKTIPPRL